jgi:hypothetical protein
MIINDPAVVAELEAEFAAYETALVTNDVAALDAFFLPAEHAIRYGIGENLYGYAAIQAFRAARPATGLARRLSGTRITSYGPDLGIAATLFERESAPGRIGRQMQTWVRFPQGWRIVAAHVSIIDKPG